MYILKLGMTLLNPSEIKVLYIWNFKNTGRIKKENANLCPKTNSPFRTGKLTQISYAYSRARTDAHSGKDSKTVPGGSYRESPKTPFEKKGGRLSKFRETIQRLIVANLEATFDSPETKQDIHVTRHFKQATETFRGKTCSVEMRPTHAVYLDRNPVFRYVNYECFHSEVKYQDVDLNFQKWKLC